MNKSFIHLHTHSEYSLLDSCLKVDDLVRRAKEYLMPAVALTDHGSILGAVGFYKKARECDIKPIIGAEVYLAPESRFSKPDRREGDPTYYHLVLLIKNEQGYRNLCELITLSFREGFYRKPRIDKEILAKYHQGLIVLSACIQGEIPRLLLRGREDAALQAAAWYRDLFGEDFFLEIQDHGLADQKQVMPGLLDIGRRLSIPMVATNDIHYLDKSDADAREILICLQTNHVLANQDRPMKKECEEMYLKPMSEMRALFASCPEAVDNTLEIAARCHFGFKLKTYYLPDFQTPGKMSVDDYFEKICLENFEQLKSTYFKKEKNLKHDEKEYETRLLYEIEKIREMGFPGYFLIVWDIIRFAREAEIPVGPGRGSVVGSLVAFVMGITTIDPLKYDLIFERFLNPARISMPDIDIDFDGELRGQVIEYIHDKYGRENVAQIITFGKMKAKLAIRDIGRVLEMPLKEVDRLAKMIPDGPKVSLADEIKKNPDLRKEINLKPETRKLIDYALKLENNIRHPSIHAAGVVIAPRKLTEFMPLYRAKEDLATHFDKEEVEEIGLLKLDILGLKTLTIIKNILLEIEERENRTIDLAGIELNDQKAFRIFQKGDSDGIFQFESEGMREYLKKTKPSRIEDLIVLNALYRPGPLESGMASCYVNRKLGKEKVQYLFSELENILSDTLGIIVFQEQVMQILVRIGGFSMSEADEMRKVMGKKREDQIPALEKEFLDRAVKRGYDKKKVQELFAQIKTFAGYGFNKSHSTAYAYLAYQTAYLKGHFPVYFMAAHLSSEAEKTAQVSKLIKYVSEAKKMGITILAPDINKSGELFRVESEKAIRFGLLSLKNVGAAAVSSIIQSREKEGLFQDYNDFITRVDLTKVNKTVLESLIKAGAFDSFSFRRRVLFESVSEVIKASASLEKKSRDRQKSLFAPGETTISLIPAEMLALPEWPEKELIKGEKEIASLYISLNPLEKYEKELQRLTNTTVAAIQNREFKGETARLGGVVFQIVEKKSKKGASYGELNFEDLSGQIKVLVFKDKWEELRRREVQLDHPYFLSARPGDGDNSSLYLEELVELDEALKKKVRKIMITIPYALIDGDFNERLHARLQRFQDSVPYLIAIVRDDGYRYVIHSENSQGLKANAQMKRDLEKLCGENTVEFLF